MKYVTSALIILRFCTGIFYSRLPKPKGQKYYYVLEYDAIQSGICQCFGRRAAPFSIPQMEEERFFRKSLNIYRTTQRHDPQDGTPYSHSRHNLKFHRKTNKFSLIRQISNGTREYCRLYDDACSVPWFSSRTRVPD
jgi:hypothetical protein